MISFELYDIKSEGHPYTLENNKNRVFYSLTKDWEDTIESSSFKRLITGT